MERPTDLSAILQSEKQTALAQEGERYIYGGGREYWNMRYTQPKYAKHKDWYCSYAVLRRHAEAAFAPYIPLPAPPQRDLPRLLVVGCGNSSVSAGLYEDGYTNIVNIDISDVIIQEMLGEGSRYPLMTYAVMDVAQMDFEEESFDVVIDKGTLDAVCCGQECFDFVHRMCNEICRVMRTGGQYVCVSYGPPYLRRHYFLKDQLKHKWRLEERKVVLSREEQVKCLSVLEDDESGTFYVYICTKLSPEEQRQQEEVYRAQQSQQEAARKEQEAKGETDAEDEEDEDEAAFAAGDFFENPFYKQHL